MPRSKIAKAALLIALMLLATNWATRSAALDIFGIGYRSQTGSQPTDLFHFNESGTMLSSGAIPPANFGVSLATMGGTLYEAEYSGPIRQFSTSGVYLGQFANVSSS